MSREQARRVSGINVLSSCYRSAMELGQELANVPKLRMPLMAYFRTSMFPPFCKKSLIETRF
ncbi:hypothetical protein DFR42_106312 [Undibacterium pigrum]|uniref:Uncharacterized protein n=1 Tax=Undibacterium pigrum TaxID=401470 RepID=A0A318J602_9BURK|nr:hypothetical protein DFR42_106312 [Undibacterium pigrum]